MSELVSTHSRAEAAAKTVSNISAIEVVSTHSRAEAAAYDVFDTPFYYRFQHTAARRRLHFLNWLKALY